MALELAWQTGTPKKEDLYLVAIKLGEGAGYYAFLDWTGSEWDQTYPENVIAFFPATEFVRKVGVKWPESEPVFPDDLNLPPAELSDFVEDSEL